LHTSRIRAYVAIVFSISLPFLFRPLEIERTIQILGIEEEIKVQNVLKESRKDEDGSRLVNQG
jgi:hypothetical protein